jgi:hypothetical protein
MTSTGEDIVHRGNRAITIKSSWDSYFKNALDYVYPFRQVYDSTNDQVNKSNTDIVFDSVGIVSVDQFVANFQASMFPPGKRWIQLVPGFGTDPEKQSQNKKALEKITDVMFSALRVSNFDTQMSSCLYDFAFGMGSLQVHIGTKKNPFIFQSVHFGQIAIEEGPFGKPGGVFRKWKMPLRNVLKQWPDAQLPEDMLDKFDDKDGEKQVELMEAMVPDDVTIADIKNGVMKKEAGQCYYVVDMTTKKIIVEREQKSSPWLIFRWPTLPGQTYAYGPVLKALPDIKTINSAKGLLLMRASKELYGMYISTDDGVVNLDNINFGQMNVIPVESTGGPRGASLAPLPSSGNLDLAQFVFNDLHTSINKIMFAEPLGKVDAPVKTATEIAYRQAEMAKRTGAAFGQLQYELVIPLVNRLLFILEELELINLSGFAVDGEIIDIEYMSPLAQAQDQEDLIAAQRYAETMLQIFGSQVGSALVPPDRFAKYVHEKLHANSAIIPTDQEFSTMKEAVLKASAQTAAQGGDPANMVAA